MILQRLAAGIAIVLGLYAPVLSAMYEIQNPAGKMYNPATQINNPASNIYNPASRMNEPNPLSPPVQPVPQQAESKKSPRHKIEQLPLRPEIPRKEYNFKTVGKYIIAAKKSFIQDDYKEFISIVEDALRRINAGTLKSTKKSKQQLIKYKTFGYGLLE